MTSLARRLRVNVLGRLLRLKEDAYPKDSQGRPDLSYYTDPVEHYIAMYEQFLAAAQAGRRRESVPDLSFKRRAHATWGMIAKGSEAVPYATKLLQHDLRDAREDGAAILAEIAKARLPRP